MINRGVLSEADVYQLEDLHALHETLDHTFVCAKVTNHTWPPLSVKFAMDQGIMVRCGSICHLKYQLVVKNNVSIAIYAYSCIPT